MFPTWLSSFKETIINDDIYVNVNLLLDCCSCAPKTPEVLVLTSNVLLNNPEVDKSATEAEMCTCCICSEPSFFVLPETVEVCNLESVEDSNSIVTIFNNDLVPG